MRNKKGKHKAEKPVVHGRSTRPLGKAPMEGGYKAFFLALFVGAILIIIHTIYLSDRTIGCSLSLVCCSFVAVFLFAWGGWWYFRRRSDESFVLAFSTGSFLVWGVLAMNYYLADWDQGGKAITPKIEKVGNYPKKSRHRQRGCYVDIVLEGKVKRIDFPASKYDSLKSRKTLPLEQHDGFFGFPVIKIENGELN